MGTGNSQYGLAPSNYWTQADWTMGECGDKLQVRKDSDIYQMTANSIVNMIPTELGNLKVIKAMQEVPINTGTIPQQMINTKYNFYIYICTSGIITINKTTNTIIGSYWFNSGVTFNRKIGTAVVMENFLFVPVINGGQIIRIDYEMNSSGAIAMNPNFAPAIRNPIKNRSVIKLDIYQVRNMKISGTKQLRPFKLQTTEKQEFSISGTSLQFKYDTGFALTRYYYPYTNDLINIEDIPNLVENQYYISIYAVDTATDNNWYIGNKTFTWGTKTTDTSGSFYTTVNAGAGDFGKTGLMNYGKMIYLNNTTGFYIMAEHQNRMVVSDGNYLYFSKKDEYNYFLNGSNDDDAFFIKLSPINNEEVKILKLISGRGLWIITDKGVFLAGYNQVVKGSTLEIRNIATDLCTGEAVEVNNTLYYLTQDNQLKAIQNTTGVKGYVDFSANIVDKFGDTDNIMYISEYNIDNKKYLLASLNSLVTRSTQDIKYNIGAYLYREVKIDAFSRVSIEAPTSCIAFNTAYVAGGKIYFPTQNNVSEAYIKLNPPYVHTKKFGTLKNDFTTRIEGLTARLFDEDNRAITQVFLSSRPIQRLQQGVQGIYSIYTVEMTKLLAEPCDIRIVTARNNKELQIQGTEIKINTAE